MIRLTNPNRITLERAIAQKVDLVIFDGTISGTTGEIKEILDARGEANRVYVRKADGDLMQRDKKGPKNPEWRIVQHFEREAIELEHNEEA